MSEAKFASKYLIFSLDVLLRAFSLATLSHFQVNNLLVNCSNRVKTYKKSSNRRLVNLSKTFFFNSEEFPNYSIPDKCSFMVPDERDDQSIFE